ncbi:MAG: exo-alpha-sialidase, partial [Planctomycetes bacterium]|nr:exo-alpha-sialidase [Planctomycetota bacterium]
SRDGGKTWTATDPGSGAAGRVNLPAIAADGKGGFVAAWIDLATLTGEDECDLFAARLEKGKDAWTPRAKVNAEGVPVCPCCALARSAGADGRVWLTCRGAKGGMREVELYGSIDGGASWTATTVSHDEWKLTACPEAGAALAVSPDGKSVALAWRHEKFLRWARVAGGAVTEGKPLDLHMAMDDVLRAGVDAAGRVVFVWTSMGEARAAVAARSSADFEKCIAPKEALFALTSDGKQVIVVRSVK